MKILLPVDGSEHALAAVRHAVRIAREGLRASFVLANVQEPASLYEVVVAHDRKVLEEVSQGAAVHSLAPAQALLQEAGLEFETRSGQGSPGEVLVDLVAEMACDAVMLGAYGMGVIEFGSLGSVATHLVRHAEVPVTVVR